MHDPSFLFHCYSDPKVKAFLGLALTSHEQGIISRAVRND
jgi:hypothetical protein